MNGVLLIGMPGSGKSTVGRLLAKRLHSERIDTDEAFIARYGVISEFFDAHGENAFRAKESEIMSEYLNFNGVISLGGGAILNKEAFERLRQRRIVVYLRASEETLAKRLFRDSNRPLLKGGRPSLSALYATRSALYEAAADIAVDADAYNPYQIAAFIKKRLNCEIKPNA